MAERMSLTSVGLGMLPKRLAAILAAPSLSGQVGQLRWNHGVAQLTGTAASSSRGFATPAAKRSDAADPLASADFEERIIETQLHVEAEQSYLAYAMSVIVGRALPDVRDGLKPVHRRILYAMHELGLHPSKPHRKCARVVGEVLGKFHPHGDTAVYDALVRMAQDFSMRSPLVDGHGNFGSLDDDPAAAMRYTECRLQPFSSDSLLADLECDTVNFLPNFDASVMEPAVLPARVPNLLVNGSSGIAVGIATKIPPHNMIEVVAGLKALVRDPDISVQQLMSHIPAPDFPTGGEIILGDGMRDAYLHGKGSITVRAKMHIEDGEGVGKKKATGKPLIVINELPYQTNKAALVEQVAKLVDDGTVTGVSDIRDESDRDGMRIVVEVKRGASSEVVLNQLLKHTTVQSRFSCNMVALVDGLPQTLNLKQMLVEFLSFRCQVVSRRAQFEMSKAERRLHLVDGYLVAMRALDDVVAVIRQSTDAATASALLQSNFAMSKEQAEGVLGMTLRRLTSLEQNKLQEEQEALQTRIADFTDLLNKPDRILRVVEEEAEQIARQFGTPRRSLIVEQGGAPLREEDIIPNSPSVIAYSRKGYIKRMNADTFAVQGLRGTGKAGARLKAEDSLEDVISVNNHDHLIFFTTEGQAFSLRAFEIPESARTAVGTAITQVLPIPRTSSVAAVLPVSQFTEELDLLMLTAQGQIKRTPLSQFSKINSRGIVAMKLRENDIVQFVGMCNPTDSALITSSNGMALHFPVDKLRPQARTGMGMKTMSPDCGSLVSMSVLPKGVVREADSSSGDDDAETPGQDGGSEDVAAVPDGVGEKGPWLFMLTKKGLGKRVPITSFRLQGRIGKGLRALRLNTQDSLATAVLVGATREQDDVAKEDILVSTTQGMLLRVAVRDISVLSRIAKGSRVVKLKEADEVGTVTMLTN